MNKFMARLAFIGILASLFTASPANATSAEVTIGMPFSGKFANSALPKTAPSSHTVYFSGDNWSTDLYAPEGTPVKVTTTAFTPFPPTFKVEAAGPLKLCENKSPGNYVQLGVYVGSSRIGQLIYEHLDGLTVKKGDEISAGKTLGVTHQWDKSSCYAVSSPSGIHTHFEMGASSSTACYADWALGTSLTTTDAIGAVGGSYGDKKCPNLASTTSYTGAFQANTGNLWVAGSQETRNIGLGVMAGTSPSITRLWSGGYQVAFQANSGTLWVAGDAGTRDLKYGMKAGTSPSITALPNGGYQVAFQANTGNLWVAGSQDTRDIGLGVMAGTSPSITTLSSGGYQVAFQANSGTLWVAGDAGTRDLKYGVKAGTSPSITALPNNRYQVAFQANTGNLWFAGGAGTRDSGLGMRNGTSPAVIK